MCAPFDMAQRAHVDQCEFVAVVTLMSRNFEFVFLSLIKTVVTRSGDKSRGDQSKFCR